MPLDINLFREEKGGDVAAIRKSNLARNKPVSMMTYQLTWLSLCDYLAVAANRMH